VFCGVHFMAESASILSPDKTVLLPRIEAGCPMADMVTVEKLREKKKELPQVPVVCYVNSTADVKAESDICCTSANAVRVVSSLADAERVLMIPDMNLALYTARFTAKEVIPWKGFCPTHHHLKAEDVLIMKKRYPKAKFVAHPECTSEVLDLADHICSTSGMYKYAKESEAKEFIIGTETGILYRLRKENPQKKFYLASDDLICPNMKLTTLEDVYIAIRDMVNVVKVPEEIRIPAKKALDMMLEIPRD
ncbi:MAG: quinolinate synthase NadA, partial [Nitrospinae bacterium]|nr:quinolinate synthase NadA [Nitrospinota bacterium]